MRSDPAFRVMQKMSAILMAGIVSVMRLALSEREVRDFFFKRKYVFFFFDVYKFVNK